MTLPVGFMGAGLCAARARRARAVLALLAEESERNQATDSATTEKREPMRVPKRESQSRERDATHFLFFRFLSSPFASFRFLFYSFLVFLIVLSLVFLLLVSPFFACSVWGLDFCFWIFDS